MDSRDDERRRGHRAPHPESLADALDQGRRAGSKRAGEHHQVTRAQQPGQALPERPHLRAGRDLDLAGHRGTAAAVRPIRCHG
jgi:hypothetical protein